ncbi:MAG: hypothetical protein Q9218_002617, partial [Villophora microphyllina]
GKQVSGAAKKRDRYIYTTYLVNIVESSMPLTNSTASKVAFEWFCEAVGEGVEAKVLSGAKPQLGPDRLVIDESSSGHEGSNERVTKVLGLNGEHEEKKQWLEYITGSMRS